VHGKHDLDSIAQPFVFAQRMSQTLKDHIWSQLGLGYTIKQMYDKHKAIWWARINAEKAMIGDNFIKQQNIICLDHKHKKGVGVYTKIQPFPFAHGHLVIQMMCFIFKMQVMIMGFMSHSQKGYKSHFNCMPWFH
jgi:hypothetical protein